MGLDGEAGTQGRGRRANLETIGDTAVYTHFLEDICSGCRPVNFHLYMSE